MLAMSSLAGGVACGAVDDSAGSEENVADVQQAVVVIEGLTVTFACNPPTGDGIVTRRCHIDYGDGQGQINIPPGTFTHTYPALGNYTYTLQEQWCTNPDCSFSFLSGSRTAEVDILLVSSTPNPPPTGSINLPGSFEGIVGKGVDMRATASAPTCCYVDWRFGDGEKDLGDNNAVTHVYNSPGTYTVRADLWSNGFVVDSDTAPARIYACKAHADCTVQSGVVSYSCHDGYRDTGTSCVDYNECAGENGGDNCSSSTRCDNTSGSFRCVACASGYRADPAGTACIDIDECARNTDNCNSTTRCDNTAGSFKCVACGTGYRADPAGTACIDIDECANGTHNCFPGGTCTNTIGSRTCTCPATQPFGNGFVCFTSQQEYDAYRVTTCNGAQQSCFNSCLPWGGSSCNTACGNVFAQCMASSSW